MLLIDTIADNVPVAARADWGFRGCYPPDSLKRVLDLFLCPNIPPNLSSSILYYAIIDLLNVQSAEVMESIDAKSFDTFASIVNLEPSLARYVLGCWFLDNGYPSKAMETFMSSNCHHAVSVQHWKTILTILMCDDGEKDALRFLSLKTPEPKSEAEMEILVSSKLTVYMMNNKCRESWSLLRSGIDSSSAVVCFIMQVLLIRPL